jgi:hypothetical protein
MKRYFLMLALPPMTRSGATKMLEQVGKELAQRGLKIESRTCHLDNVKSYLSGANQGKAYYVCCYLQRNNAAALDLDKVAEYLKQNRSVILHGLYRVNHREYLFDGLKNFAQGPVEQKSE